MRILDGLLAACFTVASIVLGTTGWPLLCMATLSAAIVCAILAVRPRDPKTRCELCGNHSFGQNVCWPCRQRFGGES